MPVKNSDTLKSYFALSKVPVPSNYVDLVDTIFDQGTGGGSGEHDHDDRYVQLNIANNIFAVHTFTPSVYGPPFILGNKAQGQTVTGLKADQLNKSVIAGEGLTSGGLLTSDITLNVGAGDGITISANAVGLTTPGTLSVSSSNNAASNHTHAITSSSKPSTSSSLLKTDTNGFLELIKLNVNTISDEAGGGNLILAPGGDITLDPTGNDVLPLTSYEINLGALHKKYLTLHAAELWVETLVAQNTIATIGGRILVGPTTTLTKDFLLSDGPNMILNADFETLGGGGTDVFANWTEQAGDGSIWSEGTNKHSGTYGLALQEGASSNTYIYQVFAVNPGDTITFQFWTRGDGTNVGMWSVYDVTHGSWLYTRQGTGIPETTWKKWGSVFGVPTGCYSLALYFWPPEPTNSYAYFDDVYITKQYLQVKHNQMAPGDLVYMEANGKVEWMRINGGPWAQTTDYAYSVTRDLDFSGMNDWYAGDAMFNTGIIGKGWIDLYSISSMVGAGTIYGPTIQGIYRWGELYNQTGEAWAIGNLNGLYGYGANTFGVGLGFYGWGYAHVTIDNVNGIRFSRLDGAGTYHKNAQWEIDGTLTIGNRAEGKANVQITDTGIYINQSNSVSRIILTSAGNLYIYNSAGAAVFTFDATQGAEFSLPLTLGTGGGIYQGSSGSFASPGTGLKIWKDGTGVGRISGYNGGIVQWEGNTNGKFTCGIGSILLDSTGINMTAGLGATNFLKWWHGSVEIFDIYAYQSASWLYVGLISSKSDVANCNNEFMLNSYSLTSGYPASVEIRASNFTQTAEVTVKSNLGGSIPTGMFLNYTGGHASKMGLYITGGLSVGQITPIVGAGNGIFTGTLQVVGTIYVGSASDISLARISSTELKIKGITNTSFSIFPLDGGYSRKGSLVLGSTFSAAWGGGDTTARYAGRISGASDGTNAWEGLHILFETNQADTPAWTERMRIKASDGNVLIAQRLDVGGLLVVQGAFHMASSMTRYTTGSGLACYAFVPLATPLTSTSWDGNESHSSDGSMQFMDLSTIFTAPGYIKAVLLQVTHMDSGANSADCLIQFFNNGTGNAQGPSLRCMPATDRWFGGQLVVTCDANGDIYRRIYASGTNTYEIFLSILGYWI